MKFSAALICLMMVAVVVASKNARSSRGHKRYSPYPEPNYSYAGYAYPPSPYSFAYAVKDEPSYNDFGHSENSNGKVVTGTYHVVLPDGRKQSVDYKVDAYSGYVADVKYEGVAYHPIAASYSPPAVPVALYVKVAERVPAAEPVAPVVAPVLTPVYGTKIEAAPVEKESEPAVAELAPAVEAEITSTEAAPVEVPTEAAPVEVAPAVEVPAEVVPEKTAEVTEPATKTESTKVAKRNAYQRSKLASPVSNEQRYYASRVIRKRQPTNAQ